MVKNGWWLMLGIVILLISIPRMPTGSNSNAETQQIDVADYLRCVYHRARATHQALETTGHPADVYACRARTA